MQLLTALLCGVLFGVGLSMSGMTDVTKVIGFLDIAGEFDPTLIFVMGGGLMISLPFFQYGLRKIGTPMFAGAFRIPSRTDIDARLIVGAALFGIGWGLVGLCPGPVIASLAYLNPAVFYFAVAMFAGMFVAESIERQLDKKIEPSKSSSST